VNPSGEQWPIDYGDQHAVIVQVGGGLRTYAAGGREILDGYAAHEMCSGGRGQVLIPWPNRLRDGRYTFAGKAFQLPHSEPARRNAIHGLVRWLPWQLEKHGRDSVTVAQTLHPQPGYPFRLHVEIEYSLGARGLRAEVSATNKGDVPLPYAAGHHPYLAVGDAGVDTTSVEVPGAKVIEVDDRRLPIGMTDVSGTELDFRGGRMVGPAQMDVCFTELGRDSEGLAWVRLRSRDATAGLGLWMDPAYRYVMLYTGDQLEDVKRRRKGLAVEPMTAPPNALASGDGLITLHPSETRRSSWGISLD